MRRTWLSKTWRSLHRLRLGVILLTLLLSAVVAGTLFPQLPQTADPSAWWEAVHGRYGALYGPLRTLGLFDVFGAYGFRGLLVLLALSTLACLTNRFRGLTRIAFRPRIQLPDKRFESAALRATLTFPTAQAAESTLRAALSRRRYRLRAERNDDRLYLYADRHRLARLGTLLTHAGLVLLVLGMAWGGWRGWRAPSLAVGPDEATEVGHGTGVGLRCDGFEIVRYDDGTPRDYRAEVTLVGADGDALAQGVVRINHPLSRGGVSYYLQGYALSETQACDVTLSAVHDPGYGPVIAAGLCLLLGLTLTFHFPHRRVWARLEPTGETALVGSSDWDKERFARQFEALVMDLGLGARDEGLGQEEGA